MKNKTFFLISIFFWLVIFVECTEKKNTKYITGVSITKHLEIIVQSHSLLIIRSLDNAKVVDLGRGVQENTTKVMAYDFVGVGNQFWWIEKVDSGYIIGSNYNKKVLALGPDNSSLVQQDYNGNKNQLWLIEGDIDAARITNKSNNKSLTINFRDLFLQNNSKELTQKWQIKQFHELMKERVSCNCSENFEFVRQHIESSYAGFQDKVYPATRGEYEKLSARTEIIAKGTNNTAICFKAINNYLLFFKDWHIHFSMENNLYDEGANLKSNEPIRSWFADSESMDMDEKIARTYFDSNQSTIASIEGIWESDGGEYRCAIVKDQTDDQHFLGLILQGDSSYWMPGQVKMDIHLNPKNGNVMYYAAKNHSIYTDQNFQYTVDTLYVFKSTWTKKYPMNTLAFKRENRYKPKWAEGFQLKNMDDSTLLLSLPDFNYGNKKIIDDLINSNRDKLLHTPFLLIDLRGNGGGTDESFGSILPFLYTNPVQLKGNDILASKENIAAFERGLVPGRTPENRLPWLRSLIERMKDNKEKFIVFAEDHTIRFDQVMPNPRKVAILINDNCASSAEEFLLFARESKKVSLFGQPTSGTLDYSNVVEINCPSPALKFGYATTKTHRLPLVSIDKDKIQPNIYLNDKVNWMKVAIQHLENKN